MFQSLVPVPIFNNKPFAQTVSIVRHDDDDNIGPLQKVPEPTSEADNVEVTLGRKRCIRFACGGSKDEAKPTTEAAKSAPQPEQTTEPPKRTCTIKFACPSKVSTDDPSMGGKPRVGRALSPAPPPRRARASPKPAPKRHRDSNSTVRNNSPVSTRKPPATKDRTRRLSANSDLAKTEAFRFHEFASSEEEVDEWTQESTCHRSRLTISDTLKIENDLRQLGEEVEEEALDDEEDEDDEDDDEALDEDDDLDIDEEGSDDESVSDEGFQTDDEEGFAGSDNESDAGSDYAWWAPGAVAGSTAATSVEYLEHIRPTRSRSVSESSICSAESNSQSKRPPKPHGKKKSRPVNIRVPSPELPDSTDFVCGTLDEDRPLEEAYMSALERRRAAKHKLTPQDIDPSFPTSDPEMEEEDEEDEDMEPQRPTGEGEPHLMMHGPMDYLHGDTRGRTKSHGKRSPALSPNRLRSPPPQPKRAVHRSPPPHKLFGQSPKRNRSPAHAARLRSPPPTRRGSANMVPTRGTGLSIRFAGLAERPALTMSSSLPRTPVTPHVPEEDEDEDTCCEVPVRRAIDIKIGLEKKRQRRKEQQYRKLHRKGGKDKRPPPGKGCERMREMGLGLAAHRGKNPHGFGFGMPPTPDQKDMHVLSI
jgi:hypothetical protein